MEPTINVDPRIYGGEAPLTNEVPVIDPLAVGGGVATAQPYEAPARVSQDPIGAGTSAVQEGQAALANANREVATMGKSALAAVKSWSTTRIWDYYNAPSFSYDSEFDPKPFIKNAPLQLTEVEHKFLASARSEEEYDYRLNNLQDQRKLYEQMGDHPILSGVIGMADPVYLAIDLASMGTATAATRTLGLTRATGRALAGTSAFGASMAVGSIEQQVAAVSDKEVLFNALLNGAASATFFNPKVKRFEKVDPTFPTDELAAAANRAERTGAAVEQRIASESGDVPTATILGRVNDEALAGMGYRNLDEGTDAYVALARFENDPKFGPMIRTLREEQGAALQNVKTRTGDVDRPGYVHDNATVYLKKDGDAFTALHESIHGLTVQKLKYGLKNPGSAHGKITRELELLRQTVEDHIAKMKPQDRPKLFKQDNDKTKSYFTTDIHEFVAGLFAGKKDQFTRILASIPAPGTNKPVLTKMIDTVRKLLGIPPAQESALTQALGLTDELMRTKLTVKAETSDTVVQSFAPSGPPAQVAQQVGGWWDRNSKAAGSKLEWSLNKSIRGKGTAGDKVADLLVDDPVNMTGNSAVSQRQAIRNDLARKQADFEDAFREMLAEQGAGARQRVFQSGKAIKVQQRLERDLYEELVRRENANRRGQPIQDPSVDPKMTKLADLHDAATKAGLDEMQASGVRGADAVQGGAGYTPRKWDVTKLEDVEGRLMAAGATERQARRQVRDMISDGIQRANAGMPKDIADDIALAITERTRRKGYFEDAANAGTMGDDGAQGIRALLQGSGISKQRMDLIEEFMTGRKDDAGVMSSLKHRVSMDMTAKMGTPDGRGFSIIDLVDTGVVRNLDNYLDDAAGQAGLARKGLTDNSEIVKLRKEYLAGIANEAERREAAALFDNTIKAIKGQPVGEEMNRRMRQLQAVTTSIGLANSGMWQLMEYANIATKYGLVKTAKAVLERMPIVKQLVGEVKGSVDEAGSLAEVLSRNSSQDLRIRPFVTKLEDNFTVPLDDRLTLALQQAKQLVPYINAMKYVHHSQANITANLISDLVRRGAKGDAKAREALAKYGLEGHQLDSIRADIDAHGMTIDSWSDGSWASVRGPLNKMMDDAVLRNRTGELPAFAQFSTLGKFIFTFRSFVLGAHNKVLAGTLGRHGFAGLGLLMAYQFPLAMATSYAVGAMRGKPESDMNKLASSAVSQMSAMGLLSELWGIASGQKQQFGSSGLMAIDRLYKVGGQAAQGNMEQAGANLLQAVPLLAILPGIKALAEQLK